MRLRITANLILLLSTHIKHHKSIKRVVNKVKVYVRTLSVTITMSRTLETESSVATMPADKKNEVLPVDKEPSVEKQENDDEEQTDDSACRRNLKRLVAFLHANDFLVLVVLAILLARAYPPLGAIYLYPKITADWLAVAIIFLLSGLNLHTEQLKYAFKQVSFNMYIQVYNFLVVSAVVFGVSRALAAWGLLSQGLADGLVICSTLSVSINMGIVMTKAVGGDEAAAIFDAAFGNLMGVFISPALILGYLKEWGDIALGTVFYKLALKVLLPIAIGQLIQKTSKPIVDFLEKYKKHFGKIQLYCLIFIIYTVFCKTFINGKQSKIGDILILVLFVFLLQVFLLILAWYSLKLLFKDKPKLRAMGIFGCTQKTISIGVPLITAIYEEDPNIALYTLPLIIWYPMQVMLGTSFLPRLRKFVTTECERLGITDDYAAGSTDRDEDEAENDAEKGLALTEDNSASCHPSTSSALSPDSSR